ncbi:MAG TPA: hypothetical protein VGU21_10525 [Streptosporangiaceae bacterium]|nr:hypothetical protein [Streptosporangiaceae bacterium]
MLPEPTIPRRRRAAPAQPQPGTMTPLFAVPDSPDPVPPPDPGSGRTRRPHARASGKPHKEAPDLLAVTAERLRRALGRSFLRYGVPGDPEIAVHAAMNVVEPVLDARDTEILRLRRLMGGNHPRR